MKWLVRYRCEASHHELTLTLDSSMANTAQEAADIAQEIVDNECRVHGKHTITEVTTER